MTRREAAMSNFLNGYNCAQSIVLACITEEGTVATSNWNCDNFDLWKIIGGLHEDIMDRYMEGREENEE